MLSHRKVQTNYKQWSNRPMSLEDRGRLKKWFGEVFGQYSELILVNSHYPLKTKLYHRLRFGLQRWPLSKQSEFRTAWGKRRMQQYYHQPRRFFK